MGFAVAAVLTLAGWARAGEWGGTCVRYVKTQKPEYDKQYVVNGKSVWWVNARDLYDFVEDWKKGSVPRESAVFIIDSLYSGHPGHAGIVTGYKRDPVTKKVVEFYVRHSNWDETNMVSTGTYRFVGDVGPNAKVTYNGGKKEYTLRGFVYRP